MLSVPHRGWDPGAGKRAVHLDHLPHLPSHTPFTPAQIAVQDILSGPLMVSISELEVYKSIGGNWTLMDN